MPTTAQNIAKVTIGSVLSVAGIGILAHKMPKTLSATQHAFVRVVGVAILLLGVFVFTAKIVPDDQVAPSTPAQPTTPIQQ
jgi:hypothetical protein